MDCLEQPPDEKGTAQRLAARFAVLWAEHRRDAEQLSAIESSSAWAVARRLSQLRRRLAPEGSRRNALFRLCLRGLRLWRSEGIITCGRRMVVELLRQVAASKSQAASEEAEIASCELRACVSNRTPDTGAFRVAFIGSEVITEAASMRYRAHHIIEALTLAGMEGTFVALEQVNSHLSTILSHDLIVLVRVRHNDSIVALIESARRLKLPIAYDLDDYLFDPWVLPYIEALHHGTNQVNALRILGAYGACLVQCEYFTGSTSYLVQRAEAWGKEGFVIRNGLSMAQLDLSRSALEQRCVSRSDEGMRIGYFSGTRTHQADFRIVYPALMNILREEADARLVIVGHLDIGEFPGLTPFMEQIDVLPICHWNQLPAVISGVDINLIPLELTPFNEGKSNLKYYEAGLLKVPSIASPTRIHRENITPGHNGLLAQTTEEWYASLKELITQPGRRERIGENAYEHVLRNYTPAAVGAEVVMTYRQILDRHRWQRDAA